MKRPQAHTWEPSPQQDLFTQADSCAHCTWPRDASVHVNANGRSPLAHDAGQTSRESQAARSQSWKRSLIYHLVVEAADKGDPACDHDLFVRSGLPWNESTAARNGLTCDRLIAPIYDAGGKTNPLKVHYDEQRRVFVSDGPWRTKPNPRGPGRVIVWVPTSGEYGGYCA